jgi:hypothetical protein
MKARKIFLMFAAIAIVILVSTIGYAKTTTVNLEWDSNSETDLAGYKLYQSTGATGAKTLIKTLGKTTTAAITSLVDGTWCWVVTAYDTVFNESGYSNQVCLLCDTVAPVISAFTVPTSSTVLDIPITALTATDVNGVVGYIITTTATVPLTTDLNWLTVKPVSYTLPAEGTYTLYAWAKDAKGNVSASRSAAVTATFPDTTAPAAPLVLRSVSTVVVP